jgi:mono/diheme cytochrome c family protein
LQSPLGGYEEGRKMVRVTLAAFGLFLLAVSAKPQDAKLDTGMALKGEQLFRTYCGSCHGKTAMGDGPLAKDLKVAPANLTKLSATNGGAFPFEMVMKTIDHGRDVRGHGTEDMPAWGDAFKKTAASPDDANRMMRELAHYLWSIQPK